MGHDPIKRLLKLKVLPVRPVPEDAPVPELARRAEQVVTHLLGTDALGRDVVLVDTRNGRVAQVNNGFFY